MAFQFHTGRELTSQDVAWNFTRLKDPKVNPTYANLVKPFAALETPDKSTLRVQFDQPNPFVVDALPNLSIIDPVSFEQQGVTKPVGTGPFTFDEYVQGDHLTLRKNPNYWDKGKPYLDELRFRIFTDPQAMMTEFEAGTLDLALQPTLNDWVRVQKDARAAGSQPSQAQAGALAGGAPRPGNPGGVGPSTATQQPRSIAPQPPF